MLTLKSKTALRKVRMYVLLAAPAILLLAWIKFAQYRADAGIVDVDGMIWNTPAGVVRATLRAWRSPDDVEVETVRLQLADGGGRSLYRDDVRVDLDLWGWGFVKAMQMDSDPELEIVSMNYSDFQNYARGDPVHHAFILDLSSGQLQKSADFSRAPDEFYWLLFAWESGYKHIAEGLIIFLSCLLLILVALLDLLSACSTAFQRKSTGR